MKLGVVGSGSIVPFHLDALKAVGFTPTVVGTRPGSARTQSLAKKYSIATVADNWSDVISASVDAF